ncbi:unnamed protein product (macronuclear) [Paramecium tetraurelia]|uniref:Uncharacterized protein n=1 Tax=Paramecium tetraurelia TaxID=5888 RepID=A0DSY3_PARTE|nr:uncharacterized protein GSPATT00019843001 [Paramecium tetraurelia]CAK86150.1 unnamed protein product [Paramecium tetraurelia]|eukprot:XP_001453547.1 hypothetical protein (macronuclear) [Paramecium tetraurelia strain d4-2]
MNIKKQDLVQDLIKETQLLKAKLQIAEQNISNLKQVLQLQSRNNSKSPIHQQKTNQLNNYFSQQSTITTVSNENLLDTKSIQLVKQLYNQIDQLKFENVQQKNRIETQNKTIKQQNQDHLKLKELYEEQTQLIIKLSNMNQQLLDEINIHKEQYKQQQNMIEQLNDQLKVQQITLNYHEVSFQERHTLSQLQAIPEEQQKEPQSRYESVKLPMENILASTTFQNKTDQEIQCLIDEELPYTKNNILDLLSKAEQEINQLLQL